MSLGDPPAHLPSLGSKARVAGMTHLPVYLSSGACVLGLRLAQQALHTLSFLPTPGLLPQIYFSYFYVCEDARVISTSAPRSQRSWILL